MEKSLFERIGGTYHQEGDYFLPDLSVLELPAIGIWGQRRRRYLKEHRQALYTAMLLSGKLYAHLLETEDAANELLESMMPGMAKEAGATEDLKARDPMRWVGLMNCCKAQVEEIIFAELVYC